MMSDKNHNDKSLTPRNSSHWECFGLYSTTHIHTVLIRRTVAK